MSFTSSSAKGSAYDLGASHTKGHANEHDFLLDDEPTIALVGNVKDTPEEIKMRAELIAQEQGMKSYEEWREWNDKRIKKGRKNTQVTYDEYKENVSKRAYENIEKDSAEKRIVKANSGMAYEGELFHVLSLDDYARMGVIDIEIIDDKPQAKVIAGREDKLKKIRDFETKTLERLHGSKLYQTTHAGAQAQAEIHKDESGTVHLQTLNVFGTQVKNPSGKGANAFRYEITPTKFKEERLSEFFGGDFDNELKKEKIIQDRKALDRNYFPTREDYEAITQDEIDLVEFNDGMLNDTVRESKRTHCIKQMWWRAHNHELDTIAKELALEKGIDYEPKQPTQRRERLTKGQLMQKYIDDQKQRKVDEKETRVQKRDKYLSQRSLSLSEKEANVEREKEQLTAQRSELRAVKSTQTTKLQIAELDAYLNVLDTYEVAIGAYDSTGKTYEWLARSHNLIAEDPDDKETKEKKKQGMDNYKPANHVRESQHLDFQWRAQNNSADVNLAILSHFKDNLSDFGKKLPSYLHMLQEKLRERIKERFKQHNIQPTENQVDTQSQRIQQRNTQQIKQQQSKRELDPTDFL